MFDLSRGGQGKQNKKIKQTVCRVHPVNHQISATIYDSFVNYVLSAFQSLSGRFSKRVNSEFWSEELVCNTAAPDLVLCTNRDRMIL